MNRKRINFFFILTLFLAIIMPTSSLFGQNMPDDISLEGLKYRSVGPSRGGRSTAVTGIPGKPFTFLMGTTGGGVWKTNDAGTSWENISDGYFKTSSIGAISVAQSDINTIYVGTGSACPRGNITQGDGVYKSTDSGRTWKHCGLKEAGLIGKVLIHPNDPALVYVAVLGNIFGPNPERGVYRSTNGGQDWKLVLHVSDTTGAIDLAMNPKNPREIYAAFWRVERKPWTIIDGGNDGGIWKTDDGGDTWKQLGEGLPKGLLGRIGLAISPVNPNRVWAIIQTLEEEDGGLYRTDNAGLKWTKINKDHDLRQRGWYYSHITAHPTNENIVYSNNVTFLKSIDGGKTFDERISIPHGDNHDLWINPEHPEIMIHANDGGVCVSLNNGETWSSQNNQPTAEFYRITADNQFPYRLYGAQQDNTTISVPSKSESVLTPQEDWYEVGGGESGHIAVDLANPNLIYAGTYIGQITRKYLNKGHTRDIVAYPQMHDGMAPRDIKYRFQWNAPIRLSPHDPNVLYHCSQYVHRTKDRGQTWEVISPDLTTDNDAYQDIPGGPIQHDHTGVELYTTIFAFEESPIQAGELWAGSDDGLIHISRDNGNTWSNITPAQMPKGGTVNAIDISVHIPGRAIVSVYKYRENDFNPYIFLTNNYGKSWTLLTNGKNGIPVGHFVRVAKEDPNKKGLLFAGTEYGMYFSLDEGKIWKSLQLNLPITPITDFLIKENDLVLATQGRSFWILDDITPLRAWSSDWSNGPAYLVKPSAAYKTQLRNARGVGAPDPAPNGAIIYYYLKDKPGPTSNFKISIVDPNGKRRISFGPDNKQFSINPKAGLNRLVWDLKYEAPVTQPNSFFSLADLDGIKAMTGTHKVVLEINGVAIEQTFEVLKDPRWEQTVEDLQMQYDLSMQIKSLLNDCHADIGLLRSLRKQIKGLDIKSGKPEFDSNIRQKTNDIVNKLNLLEAELIQTRNESRQDPINFPSKLDDQIAYLYSVVNNLDDRPNEGAYQRYQDLESLFATHHQMLKRIIDQDIKGMNQLLHNEGINHINTENR